MKERPILFSAPMVRAILAGTKTQTRRVVKPQPEWTEPATVWQNGDGHSGPGWYAHHDEYPEEGAMHYRCPYGQPGEKLWVREARHGTKGEPNVYGNGCFRYYRADYEDRPAYPQPFRWTPSIHMPRWASRITLEVTGVRVERLNSISEADAKAEGVVFQNGVWTADGDNLAGNPISAFRALWESINGPGSWDANPWVWVVEFKRVEAA